MPRLPDDKHEAFAYNLAKGMKKRDAYVHAGYKDSMASATRLSHKPEVAARINELKDEMMAAARDLVQAPTEENAITLAEKGVMLDWCLQQAQEIVAEARQAGQYTAAISGVKLAQGLHDIMTAKGKETKPEEEQKFSIKDLKDIKDVLGSLPADAEIIDVTPPPDKGDAESPLALLAELEEPDDDRDARTG